MKYGLFIAAHADYPRSLHFPLIPFSMNDAEYYVKFSIRHRLQLFYLLLFVINFLLLFFLVFCLNATLVEILFSLMPF